MERDRRWLEHCSLLIGYRFIEYYRILLRDHHIVRIAALLPGTDETVMLAEREVSILAVITFHAGKQRRA